MSRSPLQTRQVRLLREIANGPNSSVFVAEYSERERVELVAVKVLTGTSEDDRHAILRRLSRASGLQALSHRHIVPPREMVSVDGELAVLSAYIDGVDLMDWQEVLRETGVPIPGRVVCTILRSLAGALDAARLRAAPGMPTALGIDHRDLKPANVMIERDGEVKVTDFSMGLTSLRGQRARSEALQKGLAKYLAPERRAGGRGSEASDIYSLGIIGIELFQGSWLKRLRGQNPAHDRHLAEVVASLGDLGLRSSQDDRALRNSLLRMVAFDDEARPTAAEVRHLFQSLADRAPGLSLESFAEAHATPWLEPISRKPEPELAAKQVQFAEDPTSGAFGFVAASEDNDVTVQVSHATMRSLLQQDTNETTLDDDLLYPQAALGSPPQAVYTTSERTRPTFTLKDLFDEETSAGRLVDEFHEPTYEPSVSLETYDRSVTLEADDDKGAGRRLLVFAAIGFALSALLFLAALVVLLVAIALASGLAW